MQRLILLVVLAGTLSIFTGCGGNGVFPQPSSNAQLSVSPVALSFGSVRVGSSKTLSGTIRSSAREVVISTAEWSGAGYALSGISFPARIADDQKIPFKVTFTPSSSGVANGRLAFFTDAGTSAASQTLTGSGAQRVVSLSWNPSSSAVAGYNVYRGTQSGGPYSKINSSLLSNTTYQDASVESGVTYFYILRAVSINSSESSASNQASATVP